MAKIRIEPIPGIENPGPMDIRMLIDGQEVKDLAGYAIEHDAASKMPIVVIRIASADAIDIDLPDAEVQINPPEPPESTPRTRMVLGAALSVLSQADADLRQGVDISELAVGYCSLGIRQRFTVMMMMGLMRASEYADGMADHETAARLDREAITRAIAAGRLKDFAAAIAGAVAMYRVCSHGGDFATCDLCISEWARAEMAARARSGRGGVEAGAGLSVLIPRREPIAPLPPASRDFA